MQRLLAGSRSSLHWVQRSNALNRVALQGNRAFHSSQSEVRALHLGTRAESLSYALSQTLSRSFFWGSKDQNTNQQDSNQQKDQKDQKTPPPPNEKPQQSLLYKIGIGLSALYCGYTIYSLFVKSPTMTWTEFRDQVAASNVNILFN
jgi:hypothetical protein